MKNIQNIRTDYVKGVLRIQDLHDSPGQQLSKWLQDAIAAEALEANAFCLSTLNSIDSTSIFFSDLIQLILHVSVFFVWRLKSDGPR